MSASRTDMHRLQELVRLHRKETGARKVARLLGMSPNTERKYREALGPSGLLTGDAGDLPPLEALKAEVERRIPRSVPRHQVSSVEPWREEISALVSKGAEPKAVFDRLRLKHGEAFVGSHSAVKRMCQRLRRELGVSAKDVVIRVETLPGEVAQVDFGYVGKLHDPALGCKRKAWLFLMTLSFSRHMFGAIVFDQAAETWLQCHVAAFAKFGGVPDTIVPDNLKAAVIRAAFGIDDVCELNRSYRELARYYDFKVDPAPPRQPEKKGKVESGVKYAKNNFFKTNTEEDVTVVRIDLAKWVLEIAGERIHGTTGKRPWEQFANVEREALEPLPTTPFEPVIWKKTKVHDDVHVPFDGRAYSVPWRLMGSEVWIRATASTVAVYHDDIRVATHARKGVGRFSTIDEHLPEHRADLRHRNPAYWVARGGEMGDDVADYLQEVLDSDPVLSKLRVIQEMVLFLEKNPTRAEATCRRASFYGNFTYGGVKRIVTKDLDLEPLPTVVMPGYGHLKRPRYARRPVELLGLDLETTHEPH